MVLIITVIVRIGCPQRAVRVGRPVPTARAPMQASPKAQCIVMADDSEAYSHRNLVPVMLILSPPSTIGLQECRVDRVSQFQIGRSGDGKGPKHLDRLGLHTLL